MSYSNGTPAPGDVVEYLDRLYLVTGLSVDGVPIGTDSTRIANSLGQGFGPFVAVTPRPNEYLLGDILR